MTAAEVLDWLDERKGHMVVRVAKKDTFEKGPCL